MNEEEVDEMERKIPKGWFVLWCPECFVSLSWTLKDLQTYRLEEWFEAQDWALSHIEHDVALHDQEKRK